MNVHLPVTCWPGPPGCLVVTLAESIGESKKQRCGVCLFARPVFSDVNVIIRAYRVPALPEKSWIFF